MAVLSSKPMKRAGKIDPSRIRRDWQVLCGEIGERRATGGVDVALKQEVSPFFDNFPFNWAGVPPLLFYRPNFAGGRWQHHGLHDTLENVSVVEEVRLLRGLTPLLEKLAVEPRWLFTLGLPARQRSVARQLGRELFGLRA